jgi:hypothetical protein
LAVHPVGGWTTLHETMYPPEVRLARKFASIWLINSLSVTQLPESALSRIIWHCWHLLQDDNAVVAFLAPLARTVVSSVIPRSVLANSSRNTSGAFRDSIDGDPFVVGPERSDIRPHEGHGGQARLCHGSGNCHGLRVSKSLWEWPAKSP